MERLPYQPSFLAVRDPEVNRALYELYQTIAIAVNQISDSGEQVRRTGIQVVASPGVGPQGPVGPPGPAGGGNGGFPTARRLTWLVANGNSTFPILEGFGDVVVAQVTGSVTSYPADLTHSVRGAQRTMTTLNLTCGMHTIGTYLIGGKYYVGNNISARVRMALCGTSNGRNFWGLTGTAAASVETALVAAASLPTDAVYAGFRFFNHDGDTTVWLVVCDALGSKTEVDSGFAPVDEAIHEYRIVFDDSTTPPTVHFYIDGSEADGSPLATNTPVAATILRYGWGAKNLVGGDGTNVGHAVEWCMIESDK